MERYGILASKDDDQPWKYSHGRGVGLFTNGVIGGFSWPPRSYGCSFCKREFRSAQALGGHMNVHRRERARLRQYSPPPPRDSTPPNPKPNKNSKTLIPNLNNAPTSPPFPLSSPPSPPHPPPTTATKNATQDQVQFALFGHQYTLLKSYAPFEQTKIRDPVVVEEQNTMKLELAMGRYRAPLDDGLDLELRLGFS